MFLIKSNFFNKSFVEGNGLRASLTAKPEAPGTDIGLSRRPRADSDPIRNLLLGATPRKCYVRLIRQLSWPRSRN